MEEVYRQHVLFVEHSNGESFHFCKLRKLVRFHSMIKFTCEISPSPLFFSTARYSKNIAFQLLYKFSIHQQPTSSALKLFSIHTSHPATLIIRILIRKRLLSKEKHYTFYEPTHSRRILINTNGDFEQRERLFHGAHS